MVISAKINILQTHSTLLVSKSYKSKEDLMSFFSLYKVFILH